LARARSSVGGRGLLKGSRRLPTPGKSSGMGQSAHSGREGCCLGVSGSKGAHKADATCAPGSAPPGGAPGTPRMRTSRRAVFRLRCSERNSADADRSCPVSLVVFDLDETLTLVTYMTPTGTYKGNECEWAKKVNFESPWVEGSRLPKLRTMLTSLSEDGSSPRTLAILTKNQHRGGVVAVLNLLKVADLARYFSAIWTMPWREGAPNGAYQEGGTWKYFEPPVDMVHNHKADMLDHISKHPSTWFPQLKRGDGGKMKTLLKLKPEGIVLVDDQRANFQSDTGRSVLRYCKVARYDAHFMSFGLVKDMGGIGAHDDADYETLKRFVEDPWMCKETLQVRCLQRDLDGRASQHPVQLVVFDFDETLTLATFMPSDKACASKLGWTPDSSDSAEWSKADLITYNFESPFLPGSRVQKLRKLFEDILQDGHTKQQRVLAVLTRNESGVVAVLNLLTIAGLADQFSAIWTLPNGSSSSHGAYQQDGQWKLFEPPFAKVNHHKADVLHHVVDNPGAWFPNLGGRRAEYLAGLRHLRVEGIVLVDDERGNLRSYSSQAKILRYCKVARYDEVYRECGPLNQMGGLGAHSDSDYETLRLFLDQPWEYPYEPRPTLGGGDAPKEENERVPASFERSLTAVELEKAPRRRL